MALILVLAMIPAMMPASDDGPTTTMTITVTGANTATINYDGGSLDVYAMSDIELGLYWADDHIERTANQNLSTYADLGTETFWLCPAGNDLLVIGSTGDEGEIRYADFNSASAGKALDDKTLYLIEKTPGYVQFNNCTEDERKIIWEAFFVGSPYRAWDTPEPSNNDVNTVLITTVISMLFISIAVVAVRSFGGRE